MDTIKKHSLLLLLFITVIFESKGHVDLLNPQGGETFNQGDIITIQWREVLQHNTLNWDLLFSSDGGITWNSIGIDIDANSLSYNWIIPEIPTMEGRIKIVQDNVDNDYEDISEDFTISSITSLRKEIESIDFNMYPNPFTNYTTLEFDNPDHIPHILTFYDAQGRLVRTISDIKTNTVILARKNLMSGLYFFQLSSDAEIRVVGKLAIE